MWNRFSLRYKDLIVYRENNEYLLQPENILGKSCGVLKLSEPEWVVIDCDSPITDQYICYNPPCKSIESDFYSEMTNTVIDRSTGTNSFMCEDGTFISQANVCKGDVDCPVSRSTNFTDESNCTCTINGNPVHNSSFCFTSCNKNNCSCPSHYYQCMEGGYVQFTLLTVPEYVSESCLRDVKYFLLSRDKNASVNCWYDCNHFPTKREETDINFEDLVPDLPKVNSV